MSEPTKAEHAAAALEDAVKAAVAVGPLGPTELVAAAGLALLAYQVGKLFSGIFEDLTTGTQRLKAARPYE